MKSIRNPLSQLFVLILLKRRTTDPHSSFQGTTSIALHPPSGRLCYTALVVSGGRGQPQVDCAYMDGRNPAVLWRKSSIPTSLVFANKGTVIYWADAGKTFRFYLILMFYTTLMTLNMFSLFCFVLLCVSIPITLCSGEGVICSIGVDGSGYKQYKAGPGLLISFTYIENLLLWATLDKGKDYSGATGGFWPEVVPVLIPAVYSKHHILQRSKVRELVSHSRSRYVCKFLRTRSK